MRILLFAKFPPIQGGVARDVWEFCEAAAARHVHVHVITNADEVEAGLRAVLDETDARSVASLAPYVSVSATSTAELGNFVPVTKPFLSKLIGVGHRVLSAQRFDAVMGWYLEPYALAAGFIAKAYGLPLFIRTCGSDMARLALHEDLADAYAHVVRGAHAVLSGPRGSRSFERLVEWGVRPDRVVSTRLSSLPKWFRRSDAAVPLSWRGEVDRLAEACRDPCGQEIWRNYAALNGAEAFEGRRPTIGVYGKVGPTKSSGATLDALERVAQGCDFNLLWIPCGPQAELTSFFERATAFSRRHRNLVVLPPIGPWRVPEFLSRCDLVLALENGFPVDAHASRLPREIMATSSCLVLSRELADKQVFRENLVHLKNCAIVEAPQDIDEIATTIDHLLREPRLRQDIARHGYFMSKAVERFLEPGSATLNAVCDLMREQDARSA